MRGVLAQMEQGPGLWDTRPRRQAKETLSTGWGSLGREDPL